MNDCIICNNPNKNKFNIQPYSYCLNHTGINKCIKCSVESRVSLNVKYLTKDKNREYCLCEDCLNIYNLDLCKQCNCKLRISSLCFPNDKDQKYFILTCPNEDKECKGYTEKISFYE